MFVSKVSLRLRKICLKVKETQGKTLWNLLLKNVRKNVDEC